MAAKGAAVVCCWLWAVLAGLASLAVLGLTIALGVVGIVFADDQDNCSGSTAVCTNIVTINESRPPTPAYVYWLIGSTVASLLWAFVNTVAVCLFISAICRTEGSREQHSDDSQEGTEMRPVVGEEPDSADIETRIDIVGAYEYKEWQHRPLRGCSPASGISLFFGSLFFVLAIDCALWSIAVTFNHTNRQLLSVGPFIVVELLAAVVLPVLLFLSAALTAVLLDFITVGHLDAHSGLNRFLPGLKYITGKDKNYWAIENTFYFALNKRKDRSGHPCFYSCDHSFSTWVLAIIIALSIQLSFSYFVDVSLDQQLTLSACDDSRLDESFNCFETRSLNPIQCLQNNDTTFTLQCFDSDFGLFQECNITGFHCFKFLQFAVDRDLVSALAESFALYLVSVHLFSRIFSLIKVLLHIRPSRYWGVAFTVLGGLVLTGAIIAAVFWIVGYVAPGLGEIVHFNIINVSQFIMFALYLVLIGLLLTHGKWWERVDTRLHSKPLPLPLVRYSDTTRGEINKLEANFSTEKEEKNKE